MPNDDLIQKPFATPVAFRSWLANHHRTSPGLWLQIAKKGTGVASITYAEAIDEALCVGWIDGQRGALDDVWFLQRFTPRRRASRWSKINCAKVDALVEAGRMQSAGQAEIDAAKADGRWDAAYDGARSATVPEDLQAALDAVPEAAAFFATLTGNNRYAVLYRVQDAKRADTRARRIALFVEMCREGKTVY